MYAVSARKTMAGAKPAFSEKRGQEIAMRRAAERALAAERLKAAEARARRLEEASQQAKALAEELRRAGVPIRRTYGTVERRACDLFGLTPAQLHGERNEHIVFARHFVMYWAARMTGLSLAAIGNRMKKDHTTVLHGKEAYRKKRLKMGRHLRKAR